MRIVFKILVAPFVPILYILWALLTLLFCFANMVLIYVTMFGILASVIMFFTGQPSHAMVFLVLTFLISPLGLPRFAGWLIDKIDDLNEEIKYFITT